MVCAEKNIKCVSADIDEDALKVYNSRMSKRFGVVMGQLYVGFGGAVIGPTSTPSKRKLDLEVWF
jgi:hypothetical protein